MARGFNAVEGARRSDEDKPQGRCDHCQIHDSEAANKERQHYAKDDAACPSSSVGDLECAADNRSVTESWFTAASHLSASLSPNDTAVSLGGTDKPKSLKDPTNASSIQCFHDLCIHDERWNQAVKPIYHNVFDFLSKKKFAKGRGKPMDKSTIGDLNALKSRMSHRCKLQCLIHSSRYREDLMKLLFALGYHDAPGVRVSLDKDEAEIIAILKDMIGHDATKNSILKLQGEEAEDLLTLIHNMIDKRGFSHDKSGQKQRQNAKKILVKLSENCGILPAALQISGVTNRCIDPINGGGFGDIFRASYGGEMVALKCLRNFQVHEKRELVHRKFCKEALLWQSLKHPYVLPLYGIDLETFAPRLSMVSPWMQRGTILTYILHMGGPKLTNICQHLSEIAQGLEYLHSQNIIHGDLRGTNIFVDDQWHVQLADFGLAGFADATSATHTSTHAGSIRWMAPEIHNPQAFGIDGIRRTKASDVYSFACVALEIHTMKYPFSTISGDTPVIIKVMNRERPPRPTLEISNDALWMLIEDCWKHSPSDRPAMGEVSKTMIMIQLWKEGQEEEDEGEEQDSEDEDKEWVLLDDVDNHKT